MAMRSRFTRIPKVHDLIPSGVPTEVIPTYCALADHANNKTGLCWPRMETLARRLSRSPRTIQRHLHLLKEKGLVEFVQCATQPFKYYGGLEREPDTKKVRPP